jgi:hypothetical protein
MNQVATAHFMLLFNAQASAVEPCWPAMATVSQWLRATTCQVIKSTTVGAVLQLHSGKGLVTASGLIYVPVMCLQAWQTSQDSQLRLQQHLSTASAAVLSSFTLQLHAHCT